MTKTNTKIQIIMEALPVFLTTQSVLIIPANAPRKAQSEIHRPNVTCKQPFTQFIRTELIVEISTKNIPVAPETCGTSPISRKAGLQIEPPPRPKAPAITPPIKPMQINVLIFLPSYLGSVSKQFTLYLILSGYSYLLILIAISVTTTQVVTKARIIIQYETPQSLIPTGDTLELVGYKRLTVTTTLIMNKTRPILSNWQAELSFLAIA